MKMRGSSYFYIVIMVVMLIAIGLSLNMEHIESKLLPLLIGGTVFVLATIGLVREILSGEEHKATGIEADGKEKEVAGWRGYLRPGAWVVGFFLAIYLLGFIVAIPLFILAFIKSHGARWLSAIISAVITSALIYVIFELGLRVILYRGLLFTWLTH